MVSKENNMSEQNNGGPAFPVPVELCQDLSIAEQRGMTLRDYFAAKAMQVHLNAIGGAKWNSEDECARAVSRMSYEMADAMLKARG